jgi:hypothetical protein
MSHPLFDFVDKIAKDDAALRRFVADPFGDPDAADLSLEQKTALISGDFEKLRPLLVAEDKQLAAQEEARALKQAPLIGWNMVALEAKISVLKPVKP